MSAKHKPAIVEGARVPPAWPRVSRPNKRGRRGIVGRSAWPILDNREVVWAGEWPAVRRTLDRARRATDLAR
jgi:hypothetical protein